MGTQRFRSGGRRGFMQHIAGTTMDHVPHPLVPGAQHDAQQLLDSSEMVIQVGKQHGHSTGHVRRRPFGIQHGHCPPGRARVQVSRVIHRPERRTHAGDPGHPAHQHGAERIDRLDAHPRRMLGQPPAQPVVTGNGFPRELPGKGFVWRRGPWSGGASQGRDDAMAHLRGRLAGKGNGHDRLRPVYPGQQGQEPLDQQFGLAGSRGRLDDERPGRIERLETLLLVRYRFNHDRPPVSPVHPLPAVAPFPSLPPVRIVPPSPG